MILSVVNTYLSEIEKQDIAKMDPINGLDPERNWISITALLLWGILNCYGLDSENAEVFFRVVQPEMNE